jgi:hypothetical protein
MLLHHIIILRPPPLDDSTLEGQHSITYIASPEGRFLRRSSQEDIQEEEEPLDIPDAYLHNPNMDETVDVLKSIDWEFIPFWQTPSLLDENDIPNHIPILHERIL